MFRRRAPHVLVLAALGGLAAVQACEPVRGTEGDPVTLGAETTLGDGTFSSYVQFDPTGAPAAIGLAFSANALNTLPTARSDEHRCFDLDGNGTIEPDPECLATHERVLPLPPEATRRADIPFKWILLNWNPQGHAPDAIYGLPHFDVHYVMEPIENVFAIMPGPCGEEYIRCDQFDRAVVPVPDNYMHPDFQNVGAAVPAMGNHLVDLSGHEFHGSTFDRTWMYGAYEGRVIFWEEMVTRGFLLGRPDTCFDIKTPAAVAVTGHYPTRSCFRFHEETGEQRMSIEGFVYRAASDPAASQGDHG
jgi:hypothetical protein